MIATFQPCKLKGNIDAPPSKSMAHRYLIAAALSGNVCHISGIDYSEDILATLDSLRELGSKITKEGDGVIVEPEGFMKALDCPVLNCRESGSTLRFLIPLALCLGKEVTFIGSERLLERPLDVYEEICHQKNFLFEKSVESVKLCGKLESGNYKIRGDISSQFITGMIFALVYLGKDSTIQILPPFESRSYVELTISTLKTFGVNISFTDTYQITIKQSEMHPFSGKVEGDYSNAAFLDAFSYIGSELKVQNLNDKSLQGDSVYKEYFEKIRAGVPTLDISNCPDLGPVLIALAALKNGAILTGTKRLKLKESDRGSAMHEELRKLGGGLILGDDSITVPKQELKYQGLMLEGHNDHRIVMAMSLVLAKTGGVIAGAEAVKKSYPGFYDDIKRLGAVVELEEETVGN